MDGYFSRPVLYSIVSLAYLLVQFHGLRSTHVKCLPSVQRAVTYHGVRLQFGMTRQNFLIKLALPLYFYFVTRSRDLLYPRHRALVPLGQRIPIHCSVVTERLARMTVYVTVQELDHPGIGAKTVHTEAG